LFAPVGVVKLIMRTDPEDAGIGTLFLPAWCLLLVVVGLLAGRRLGPYAIGGKRAALR